MGTPVDCWLFSWLLLALTSTATFSQAFPPGLSVSVEYKLFQDRSYIFWRHRFDLYYLISIDVKYCDDECNEDETRFYLILKFIVRIIIPVLLVSRPPWLMDNFMNCLRTSSFALISFCECVCMCIYVHWTTRLSDLTQDRAWQGLT